MKRILALAVLVLTPLVSLRADVTVSGPDNELARYFTPKTETIQLSGAAAAALSPTGATIQGFVEIGSKPFTESQQLVEERCATIRRQLDGLTVQVAEAYQDPSTAIEIQKLKKLTAHGDFRIEVAALSDVERVLRELAGVANVTINEIRPRYAPTPELAAKLLNAAIADLQKQKVFCEDAFGVELRLRFFSPFNGTETGGAAEEEIVELSPFSVDPSSRWRYRQKNRAEEMVLTKAFQKMEISKRISAVYEIHPR